MGLKGNRRSRKGFTLVEVVVVVAIAALVLAVGVPAVAGAVKRVDLKKMDGSAQSIFLAAQNSLTAMAGNGELEDFAKDADGDYISGEVPAPSDFPKITDASGAEAPDPSHGDPKDLRFLDSIAPAHQDALKRILPGGSIDRELENGRYIVEYNRKTGAVYAVWYSDEKEFVEGTTPFDHEPRAFDDRLKLNYRLGCCGGSGTDYAKVGQMPIPQLTVLNGEELVLRIKMPESDNTEIDGKIGLAISITGQSSKETKVLFAKSNDASKWVKLGLDRTGDLVLDTFKSYTGKDAAMHTGGAGWEYGKAFSAWNDDNTLIPGEDITITVTAYCTDPGLQYLSQTATATTNSLFASIEDTTKTARIAYGRHLQNLNEAASGVKDNITKAVQLQEIDFNRAPASGEESVYSWKTTYPAANFTPINNEYLEGYNGNSLPIKNLTAKAGASGGMFDTLTAPAGRYSKLENIVLVNTTGAGGALAARLVNFNILNCRVYLMDDNDTGFTAADAGGAPLITGETVGGLVGAADGCEISNSFASTAIKAEGADAAAGGLVGASTGTSVISFSYAASYIDSNGCAGGLTGKEEGVGTISNSYAAGVIANASGAVGGLVAEADSSLSINNSYSATRLGTAVAGGSRDGSITVFGAAESTNAYYVRQAGVKYADDSGNGLTPKQLSGMKSGTGALTLGGTWYSPSPDPENPAYAAFPYKQTADTADLTTPYPYPMLSATADTPMLHYGDWLEREIFGYALYREQEEDNA